MMLGRRDGEARQVPSALAPTFTATSVGPTAVLVYHLDVEMAAISAISAVFARLRLQFPETGFGFLTLVKVDTNVRPPSHVRAAVATLLKQYNEDIRAAAIVYGGDGFQATIVRSVITAITLASGTRFPNRVFAEIKPAIAWLAQMQPLEMRVVRDLERTVAKLMLPQPDPL
jgi:hypothetical protein